MKESWQQITDQLSESHGYNLSRFDESFLERTIQKRISETLSGNANEYMSFLHRDGEEGKLLYRSMHINYSEFFRNPLSSVILESFVLPALVQSNRIRNRKKIRIWSAACAAGQEVYSLAMQLKELRKGEAGKTGYRIFASDACESQVNEAIIGFFPPVSLNNISLGRINRWFTLLPSSARQEEEIYAIKEDLKENIEFSVFDLFNEEACSPPGSIFGDFDMVLCSNLLFYYSGDSQEIILNRAGDNLAPGGYLVSGETEREIVLKHNFREVFPHSAVFQKR
jgi:chemotaxis protein methyltransferase CheR